MLPKLYDSFTYFKYFTLPASRCRFVCLHFRPSVSSVALCSGVLLPIEAYEREGFARKEYLFQAQQVYKGQGISQVEVDKRVGNSFI